MNKYYTAVCNKKLFPIPTEQQNHLGLQGCFQTCVVVSNSIINFFVVRFQVGKLIRVMGNFGRTGMRTQNR